MGRYLLDTHTAIWYFNGDKALSEAARKIILDRRLSSAPTRMSLNTMFL